MSSSKRWTSASGTELPGRLSPLPASVLSPVRQSARRSVSRSEPATTTSPVAVSIARTLWPSSSTGNKSGKSKAPPAPPSPLSSAPPPPPSTSVATLADHLVRDDAPRALSRQRSCTELPRFADADVEARKIGKPSGTKGGAGHAFGRSMRFLPSTRPAGVTLTPGRVAPSDLRRLANAASLDAAADVASSGSECSDASRGSATTTPRTASTKPHSPLLPRTGSVRLLGSSNTQWALSPGRRSGSPPLKATTAVATVPESKGKKSLISLGWGHIFHRRKHAAEDASIAAVTATLLSSPVPSRSSAGGGEAGHHMRMAHCRLLQWRFANAKADAVRSRKMASAELDLMGTWARVSEMRGKVARKRVQLEKEKQKIKLNTVLSFQMKDLESWGQLQTGHDSALSSTVDCTQAAVCRLPLTNGAKVSLAPLSSVLHQALELTLTAKAMTRSFSPMAQETALLISKLVRVAREEQAMLQECVELLRLVSALQVEEQSLRSHLVQSASLSAVIVK
ncbi:QWRF motif-containing protein 3-like [Miscanthus floridulus]|uniref:QWRF motif-containing protein 3-like n=1 Tax=Miscanthus floridulus TaxID=154761 RepID=UPI003458B3E2